MANPLIRLAVKALHEAITEYRRLDAPPPEPPPPPKTEINNTSASTGMGFSGYHRRPTDARADGRG